jgi:hypothetical protein
MFLVDGTLKVLSYLVSSLVLSCFISCRVLSCLVLSCRVVSFLVLPCLVLSDRAVLSYLVLFSFLSLFRVVYVCLICLVSWSKNGHLVCEDCRVIAQRPLPDGAGRDLPTRLSSPPLLLRPMSIGCTAIAALTVAARA